MKHRIQTIAIILFGVLYGHSQGSALKKGVKNYNDYAFIDVRDTYSKLVEDGHASEDILSKLGDSYYYTGDYINASKWYGQLHDLQGGVVDSEYLYRYALSLKSTEDYTASDLIMEEFINTKGSDYRSNLFSKKRDYLEGIQKNSGRFEVANASFNTALSDFAPAFYKEGLIFASNGVNAKGAAKRIHGWNNQPFLDLFRLGSSDSKQEEAGSLIRLDNTINSKFHESTAVYTKDGNTMYFTRNNFTKNSYKEDDQGTNHLKLYRAVLNEKNRWDVEELHFCDDQYSVAHPALSVDEKTLYFASDMPGGKGRSDLYKVAILDEGFGTPVSLGDAINTAGRETFPFISSDNKLYFASDAHVGLGGLDIFVSEITAEGFGESHNLGTPVNSPQDDFTFVVNAKGDGYFASNRTGGVGDDDIYSFKTLKPLVTTVKEAEKEAVCMQRFSGVVRDDRSEDPLGEAKVLLLNNTGKVVNETVSDYKGAFAFKDLECNTQYSVRAEKQAYSTKEKAFATGSKSDVVERTLYLRTGQDLAKAPATIGADLFKILGLNMIYFDLNKANIRQDAEIELRKVIAFMELYPNMSIDVRSHTDSRSRDAYNMELSQRRAQSTVDYIVNKGGIDRSRLKGHGYGETALINGCNNGVKCSEYEHQRNRRSEFIIIN